MIFFSHLDLRVKMEAPDFPSSGGVGGGGGGGGVGGPYSAPPTPPAPPPDAPPDIPLWPTKHLATSKSGGIATADGKISFESWIRFIP